MKRLLSLLLLLAVIAAILPSCAQRPSELTAYSRDEYRDRTLGGIIGQVAGVLSGFEFVWNADGTPAVALPEDWFSLCGGPYGGGDAHGGAGVDRILGTAKIGSDDDYHIDFFNQLILAEKGVFPAYFDLYSMWTTHQVSDWGGGYQAMSLMEGGILPPFTGLYESGNIWSWCTESYIEVETLGMNAPGMPQTAYRLANRFAKVTGDADPVLWGSFYAALYAQAYLETDAREALRKAAAFLPEGSWPAEIYRLSEELYRKYPGDWRSACRELENARREIFDCNNILCSPDVNNGFFLLSILYGENDYQESVKIASLAGYDGDCTAAAAGGLLGITHGMDGLPTEVKERIYAQGEGRYVNDLYFDPHIGADYPDEQSWDEICDLYVENAQAQIRAKGGWISRHEYGIPVEPAASPVRVQIVNPGFEKAERAWTGGERALGEAHTGNGFQRLRGIGDEATQTITGLETGEWYCFTGYLRTGDASQADLFVRAGETMQAVSAYSSAAGWIRRDVTFLAEDGCAEIGFRLASGEWAGLDDVSVARITQTEEREMKLSDAVCTEAFWDGESLTLSATPGSGAEWRINGCGSEQALRIDYQNAEKGTIHLLLFIDGESVCTIPLFSTGLGKNTLYYPISLEGGKHSVRLTSVGDRASLYHIALQEEPALLLRVNDKDSAAR